MDRDLLFLVGLVFLPLAFVALVSAWADRRRPWAALILAVVGLAVAIWASVTNPDGPYQLTEVPALLLETIGSYWAR